MNYFGAYCIWFIAALIGFAYLIALGAAIIEGARRLLIQHENNRCRLCNCLRW